MTNKEIINFYRLYNFWENSKENIRLITDDIVKRFEEDEKYIEELKDVYGKLNVANSIIHELKNKLRSEL